MKNSTTKTLCTLALVWLLVVGVIYSPTVNVSAQSQEGQGKKIVSAQSGPPQYFPNDPYGRQWQLLHSMPEAWALEQTRPVYHNEAIVVVADHAIDCSHPDLVNRCLPELNRDFTGDSAWLDASSHGTRVSSLMSQVDNNLGTATGGDLDGRVKFFSAKIVNTRGIGPGFDRSIELMLQYVLDLKRSGRNIVAINYSIGGFSRSPLSQQLLNELASENVPVVAGSGDAQRNFDNEPNHEYNFYPRDPQKLFVVVGGAAQDGSLSPFSNFGPGSISVVAQSLGVPIASTIPPYTSGNTASGTSFAAPAVCALFAHLSLYRNLHGRQAWEVIKQSALWHPSYEGKVGSGLINFYQALTYQPPSGPVIVTEENAPTIAITLDGLTFLPGPYFNAQQELPLFGGDSRTRVAMFLQNITFAGGQASPSLVVTAVDGGGIVRQLPIELVAPLVGATGFSQATVILPQGLGMGPLWITVEQNGLASLPAYIMIQ